MVDSLLPDIDPAASRALEAGLTAMKISVKSDQITQLLTFVALLSQWNKVMNLTAVRGVLNMVQRHLLDSLCISPYIRGTHIIDVGTGAGLPGIPLAIINPERTFALLDSNQKKQIFVSYVVNHLGLENVTCVKAMVQTYQPTQKFSTILSRALAPSERLVPLTAHLLAEKGCFLAMMGKIPSPFLLPSGYILEQIIALTIPGEVAQRHLAIITKECNI